MATFEDQATEDILTWLEHVRAEHNLSLLGLVSRIAEVLKYLTEEREDWLT